MTDTTGLESFAQRLEKSGDYRILRRMVPHIPEPALPTERIGIILDLETTGLNTSRDEVIEIAMVKFGYARGNNQVTHVIDTFQAFNQPSAPISAAISELTGITDTMVAGHRIDSDELAAFVGKTTNVIIAHNAAFDRKLAEQFWPLFTDIHWACSATGVDWKRLGCSGAKLDYLLAAYGLFHGAHRALDDCQAVLQILARQAPGVGKSGLALLLERARRMTHRIWAENSPFELKNELKHRGYRWSDGSDGHPRAWYIDVDEGDLESELMFLKGEIYQRDTEIAHRAVTARDRYSGRI